MEKYEEMLLLIMTWAAKYPRDTYMQYCNRMAEELIEGQCDEVWWYKQVEKMTRAAYGQRETLKSIEKMSRWGTSRSRGASTALDRANR